MELLEKYKQTITNEQINSLPLRKYDGPIHLVRSKKKLESALEELNRENVLGFDTETRPAFTKGTYYPPSLVQLAGGEAVYIFQFSFLSISQELVDLLANPSIIKAGVAVRDDIKALKELRPFEDAGFVDLGEVSRDNEIPTNGLRNMAANFLGYRVSKGARRSNWAVRQLSRSQILYAATDAWVSRELYLWMKKMELV